MRPFRHARPVRHATILVAGLMLVGSVPLVAADDDGNNGNNGNNGDFAFDTSRPAMLDGLLSGFTVDPLITTGDVLPSGYRFEAIPDGISFLASSEDNDQDGEGDDGDSSRARRTTIFVNHETSTVPFPYPVPPTAPTEANAQNDFDNSQVSKLVLNSQGRIVNGELVIQSGQNFHRFCSNYLPTQLEGFDRPILFTNEEGVDWVNRTGTQWPAPVGAPTSRQIGVVVAYDVRNGETREIWGMGRLNHENSVAIPGYDEIVMLTGDDTFTTTPSQSQLYSYIADSDDDVWSDNGALWAFRSTTLGVTRYEDFNPITGVPSSIAGEFIQVPRLIATGRHATGVDIKSSDPEVIALLGGSFPPPNDPAWQKPPGTPSGTQGMDGPQWVLEKWSQLNDVFDFVRLEDIAYDKRPGMQNTVYLVDSGRGTGSTPPQPPIVLGPGVSTNGRIWKMVLDKEDPKKVTSLSILIEGDDNLVKTPNEIHQPDNIESTQNGLYFTEDPGSQQQFNFTPDQLADPRRTEARIFQYLFNAPAGQLNPRPIFKVNQSQDEEIGYDVDGDPTVAGPRGSLGTWESSGIVDASATFGPGAFLVTIQAHTLWIEKELTPQWTNKREGGQLVLVRIPGG